MSISIVGTLQRALPFIQISKTTMQRLVQVHTCEDAAAVSFASLLCCEGSKMPPESISAISRDSQELVLSPSQITTSCDRKSCSAFCYLRRLRMVPCQMGPFPRANIMFPLEI